MIRAPDPIPDGRCATCAWFGAPSRWGSGGPGPCLRHAPIGDGSPDNLARWPRTWTDKRCGDYEPRTDWRSND